MGEYRLGHVLNTGRGAVCSTGSKLPLGKLDRRLFAVFINSPSTNAILRDLDDAVNKNKLHPANDNMNFTLDRANRKATFEFYAYNLDAESAQWIFVEVHVPDELATFTGYGSASGLTTNWEHWLLDLWDTAASDYVAVMAPETGANANYIWSSALSKYLDGNTFQATNGDGAAWWTDKSAAAFSSALKAGTGLRKYDGMANKTITYNVAGGCKRRLGFVVNIPAAGGIRNRITVYFD